LLYAALWSVMLLAFLKGAGYIRTVLESKPMRFLGMTSFSSYLWHWFIINLVKNHLPISDGGKLIIIYSATILLSYLSYLVFERPFYSRLSIFRTDGSGISTRGPV